MPINDFYPSPDLYLRVRAGFVQQGSSLSAWCRTHDVHRANAISALVGAWNGPKGRALRKQLIEASGIRPVSAPSR